MQKRGRAWHLYARSCYLQSVTGPLVLGIALGVRHALDADHVATIANVVVARPGVLTALRTALFWGVGHSISFLLVGLAVVLLRLQVPPGLELFVDLAIAASLLVLGGIQILNAYRNQLHAAPIHPTRPLALGGMHGLAGSAAIALLALTTIRSEAQAIIYLLSFCVGTIAGMAGVTAAMAWFFGLSIGPSGARRALVLATGIVGAACGVAIATEALVGS